ncbi:MAG: TPM domain-containing protein [Chitinophagaceae bacterium]|nr:TPM domain-containing protein [Chitinophagaceae bacterium]
MKLIRNIVLILLVCSPFLVIGQNIPSRPNPPKLVNDQADVLSPDEESRLERKLVAYDDSTSNQVVILTIQTLEGYPIEEYALKIFRDWGIGNKTTNNGVLILAVIEDRQVRIEVGYGLEGAIPDITANQIIRNDIAPGFRSNNYYEGFDKASESVIKAAAGEYKAPEGYRTRTGKSGKGIGGMIVAFIVIIFILSNINRRGGGGGGFMSRRGYRGLVGPSILASLLGGGGGGWGGSGGGGGWSGGGGGFGGFGGGSSGGGGASGSW